MRSTVRRSVIGRSAARFRLASIVLAAAGALLSIALLAGVSIAASASVAMAQTGPTSYAFQPRTLTVVVGTRVTWTNPTTAPHSVTATGGAFDSGYVYPGSTYTRTFSRAGTYAYRCTIHPGQTGTIVVRAAAGTGLAQPETSTEGAGVPPALPGALLVIALAAGLAWLRRRPIRT